MLVGADRFMQMLSVFRQVWIRGRLGGGKTLLAVALAEEMIRRKMVDGVVSNIPTTLTTHPWRDLMPDGTPKYIRGSVILFDEAWLLLDCRTSIANPRMYGAFARKLGTYWLYPSVLQIDKRNSFLYVERVQAIPGLNWWVYKWALNLSAENSDGGTFVLMRPSSYFGKFDSSYVPLDDADIGALWDRTIEVVGRASETQWFERVSVNDPRALAFGASVSRVRDVGRRLEEASQTGYSSDGA